METDKSFCVLVVSEDNACLDITSSILSPYYSVKSANSSYEALKLLKTNDIGLIILDYSTRGKAYGDFLAKIKSSEESMRVPVVLIGDASRPEDEERSFDLGAVDYISKPFRASVIKIRVNNQRRLIKHIKAIEEIGILDSLTSIYNRRGLDNRIHLEWLRAIRDKTCFSLAIADLDHFKKYNDSYGHVQGDALLRNLARQFVSMLKRPADFVGRWGGEEFVIVLPCTEQEGAFAHLEDIRKSVEEMSIPNLPPATISIGLATIIPTKECSIENFFSQADEALYRAKNSGRNRVES
ncbi:MAG: diguanylate cyclase [Fibromonadaceae bacterium]|jgi:diguanylate cyclase (GGDEF)-like protein|nr:diguanylate cyclase [Fibromonadaceae bacterium]